MAKRGPADNQIFYMHELGDSFIETYRDYSKPHAHKSEKEFVRSLMDRRGELEYVLDRGKIITIEREKGVNGLMNSSPLFKKSTKGRIDLFITHSTGQISAIEAKRPTSTSNLLESVSQTLFYRELYRQFVDTSVFDKTRFFILSDRVEPLLMLVIKNNALPIQVITQNHDGKLVISS